MRRMPIVEFVQDMGAPFRQFLDCDDEALSSLASWGGLTAFYLESLRFWTGETISGVRMRFRSKVFVSGALRNPTLRGCPVCLREDMLNHLGAAVEAMAMRGEWQFREVALCLHHNHLLVPLWQAENRYARDDFAQRFRGVEANLKSGTFDRPFARRLITTFGWTGIWSLATTRLGWQIMAFTPPPTFAGSSAWNCCECGRPSAG